MAATSTDLVDELFDEDDEETTGAASDLLDEVPETDATPWTPEDEGEGVAGVIEEFYEVEDEYNPDDTVPCMVLRDDDGERWSIRGYRTVLRKEIRKRSPEVGDTIAVKYLGEREMTKGPYKGKGVHVYRTAIRKA